MTHLGKLKQLIETIKVSNEVMKRQLDLNGRTLDLLGSLIIEPESLGKAPYSDKVPSLSGQVMVGQEIEWGNEWVKYNPNNIRPKDMKVGEWYILEKCHHDEGDFDWIIKFESLDNFFIYADRSASLNSNKKSVYPEWFRISSYNVTRKATREEVIKYFPHEYEISTHGGNDVPNIDRVTDEQL